MKKRKVTLTVDEVAQHSLDLLDGTPLMRDLGHTKERPGDPCCEWSRLLAIWLEEATHALAEHRERTGSIPRQPRFAVITDEDGGPAPARRPEVIEEMRREEAAIEAVLAKAAEG